MGLLEENLKLGLQAVKYAKENITRSANQHYFKSTSPFQQNKRNDFLLGATRNGSYVAMEYEDGSFAGMEKDDEMSKRRKQLEQLIATPMDKKEKKKKIDALMKEWGQQYFWGGNNIMRKPGTGLDSRWDTLSSNEKIKKIAKRLGVPENEIRDIFNGTDQDKINFVWNMYQTKFSADNAKKFGVGNCQEKGELAALYIMDQTPGGVRLALFSLEEEHKGVTGLITGQGGDHVFAVYGHDNVATSISALGPNAIIVDGWMNDAYPAQKHLSVKHGQNYNNVRINIKQFTTRNMVCVSYRSHIQCLRDFGILEAGRKQLTPPTIKRTNF